MALRKPPEVAADAYKSAKWAELVRGRAFGPADAPALALLCQWHKVAAQATEELEGFGGQTAYTTESGELRAFPQVATLKAASAEIRALRRQLGLEGAAPASQERKATALEVIRGSRDRKARAAGQG